MSSQAAREDHLRSLLLMPVLGLNKPHQLEKYSGTVLGLMTRRNRPYSADEMDHFILSCVRLGWAEELTADVARWTTQLWADDPANERPYRYWDWHVKTVYSDYHLPRSKHGTSKRIVYARKQLMLHDQAGHLLLMKTYRGDTNLIEGMVTGTAYCEGIMASQQLSHQIKATVTANKQRKKKENLAKISQAMKLKPMYELDDRKDQLMGAIRVYLTNILQHLRDTVFPAT